MDVSEIGEIVDASEIGEIAHLAACVGARARANAPICLDSQTALTSTPLTRAQVQICAYARARIVESRTANDDPNR